MSQWGQPGYRPPQGYQQNGWGAGRPAQGWGQPTQQWGPPTGWGAAAPNQWSPNSAQTAAWGQVPARKRRNPFAVLLKMILFVFGFIVLGTVALIAVGVFLNGTIPDTPPVPDGPGTSQTGPVEPYQNEDYEVPPAELNPPELPMPETYEQAADWLTDNAIYSARLNQPVACEATPIDLATASTAELQDHMNEFTACLMRVFGPALEDAGYVPVRPTVTIYSSEISTKCGTVPMNNAVYCGADQQVYYAIDLPEVIPYELRDLQYVVESVIAHEFGHAIQGRTGILISEMAWEQESSEADANNLSRRLETQADCFAGQFISSVAQSVEMDTTGVEDLSELFYAIGDDQLTGDPTIDGNHGHGISRQLWYLSGANSPAMSACNTFVADDSEVR